MTVSQAPLWAVPLGAALLLAVAAVGAVLDAVLDPVRGSAGTAALRTGTLRTAAFRPVAETARLLRQRRRTTVAPDTLLWRIGLATPLVAALLMVVVVPVGGWVISDLAVGVVWFNAMDVLVWAAMWLAGWGPNSVAGLVGGYRFLAQALSYELPLMFALTAPAVAAASLRMGDVVAAQQGLWFVVWMPVAFAVFLVSVLGFSACGPLASPAGRDVAGGVLAEPAGVDRLLLLVGRYALLAAGSATAVTLFLGGGGGPLLPGWLWLLLKTIAVLAVLVGLRRRVPAVHPERLASLAWLVALPATLLQLLVVSVVVVGGS